MSPIGAAFLRSCLCFCASALVALAAPGCTPHLSEEPAGEVAVAAKEFWNGTWVPDFVGSNDAITRPVTLVVRDAERGVLDAYWIELAAGKPVIRKEGIFLRRAGPWLLASVPVSAFYLTGAVPLNKTLYAWARVELLEDNLVAVSVPNAKTFAGYEGKRVHPDRAKDRVVVARVGADLLGHVKAEDEAWVRPFVFRKLNKPEKYPFEEDQ